MLKVQTFSVNGSPPSQNICRCKDCGKPLDAALQDDGKGGHYIIVTCWNPDCLLRTVTRSLSTYHSISDDEWEAYREMNRQRGEG